MATTTGTTVLYDSYGEAMGDGEHDNSANTFKAVILASGYTPSQTHTQYSDLTNELSTANGYTAGGQTLANVTWSRSGGTTTFDADDPVWTASGGSIAGRYFAVYDDTSTGDLLVCYGLLDVTPADVTATDGNTLTIGIHASGLFNIIKA